jgi:hypothetical protein
MTATALVGAGVSAYSAINSANKQKKAERALNNLESPQATNVAENLKVSTLGADLRTQEAGRTSATAVDALRGGGARAIIGGIGAVQANNDLIAMENAKNLDDQQQEIERLKAEDERRIQGIDEQKYQQDVSALSSQINSANEAKQQGIANSLQSLGSAGQSVSEWRKTRKMTTQQKIDYEKAKNGK